MIAINGGRKLKCGREERPKAVGLVCLHVVAAGPCSAPTAGAG